jgi:hypothetical protein
MLGRLRQRRDPFWDDGVAARERNHRYRIESATAFCISIIACGLTVAMWLRTLVDLVGRLAFR